jgi:hypothetical protein
MSYPALARLFLVASLAVLTTCAINALFEYFAFIEQMLRVVMD